MNSVRLSLDGSVLVTATASDLVEVWRLDQLQRELAGWNLDWSASPGVRRTVTTISRPGRDRPALTLALSLAGCVLAGVFAVLTLRQHRASIRRFLAAEADAAERSRQLELARIELMHSQKMQALGTLSAGIAHDFNNLLSVIRMSNKLIGRRITADMEVREHVADIEQAAVQGKNVVRSMLGYAREASPATPTNVNEVVETTVSLLSKQFLSGIRLTLELSAEAQVVTTYPGLLEQILLNLIINASDAMQGCGRLTISTHLRLNTHQDGNLVLRPKPVPRYIVAAVSDSGPGISSEIMDRIFDPFFTTKRSSSTTGTGLGLSQVYSIAQEAGLGLSVDSEPGAGATFSVWIPIDCQQEQTVRETHTSQPQR